MTAAGFGYPDPMAANNDPLMGTGTTASSKEIAVATADARCKRTVDYMTIRASVEAAYQGRAINPNNTALDALRANLANQLRQANGCQAPGLMESWLAGFQGCGDRLGHRV